MKNSLRIKREQWPDVTDTPHFIVTLNYQGYAYSCDDIYFDDLHNTILKLQTLAQERKGSVELDGGFRFKLLIASTSSGSLELTFKVESGAEFPGQLRLEGHFPVDGENTGHVIEALVKLFRDGKEFAL